VKEREEAEKRSEGERREARERERIRGEKKTNPFLKDYSSKTPNYNRKLCLKKLNPKPNPSTVTI
jgi:hypothetical protein